MVVFGFFIFCRGTFTVFRLLGHYVLLINAYHKHLLFSLRRRSWLSSNFIDIIHLPKTEMPVCPCFLSACSLLMTGAWRRPLSPSRTERPSPRSCPTRRPKARSRAVSQPALHITSVSDWSRVRQGQLVRRAQQSVSSLQDERQGFSVFFSCVVEMSWFCSPLRARGWTQHRWPEHITQSGCGWVCWQLSCCWDQLKGSGWLSLLIQLSVQIISHV